MNPKKNSAATPLVEKSLKLHKLIYQNAYPYPLDITMNNHKISVKFRSVFKLKYIPFLFALNVISFGIGIGCCILIPFYKLFCRSSFAIGILPIITTVFLGSSGFLECGTYLAYCKSTQVGTLINQLFSFEQNRKNFNSYVFKAIFFSERPP